MLKVLLVEDLADQRQLYHDVLSEAGFEVIDAWRGEEAMELFVRCHPDVVVLDIQMPGLDGISLLGKMRMCDSKVPVIFNSAYPAHKTNFLTFAADAFVEKTGDTTELVNTVKRLVTARGLTDLAPKTVYAPELKNAAG